MFYSIFQVISKNSLSEKTKQAAAEERERKQRILEKQKKVNELLFDILEFVFSENFLMILN